MIVDQQVIDFLQDINNTIESVIDLVQTFIKLYIEQSNKHGKLE